MRTLTWSKGGILKKSIQIIVSSLLFLSLAACQKKQDTDLLKNFVTEKSEFPRIIGDEKKFLYCDYGS